MGFQNYKQKFNQHLKDAKICNNSINQTVSESGLLTSVMATRSSCHGNLNG